MRFPIKCLALATCFAVLTLGGPAAALSTPEPVTPDPAHEADVEHFAAALQQSQEDRWWAWAAIQEWNKAVAHNEAVAAHARAARASRPRQSVARSATPDAQASNGRHYLCPEYASGDNPSGDFAVPCYIVGRESHGSYTADNPSSSAYGAYQILHLPPGTPPAEQDAIARGMALCNWSPPHYCAG